MSQRSNPAQAYEDYLVPHMFRPFALDLIDRAAPQAGERVLDVACGTGVVARLAAPLVGPTGAVTGLDLSEAMLAVAQESAAGEGLNIAWRAGNAAVLPFDDGSFDLVLCEQGLQFVPDKQAAVREMRRVLAPGGRALVATWSPLSANAVTQIIETAATRHLGFGPGAVPFGMGGVGVLEAVVRSAGFTEVTIVSVRKSAHWPSYAEYLRRGMAGVIAVVPALATLSPEEIDTLVRAVEAEVSPQLAEYIDGEALITPFQTDIAIARG